MRKLIWPAKLVFALVIFAMSTAHALPTMAEMMALATTMASHPRLKTLSQNADVTEAILNGPRAGASMAEIGVSLSGSYGEILQKALDNLLESQIGLLNQAKEQGHSAAKAAAGMVAAQLLAISSLPGDTVMSFQLAAMIDINTKFTDGIKGESKDAALQAMEAETLAISDTLARDPLKALDVLLGFHGEEVNSQNSRGTAVLEFLLAKSELVRAKALSLLSSGLDEIRKKEVIETLQRMKNDITRKGQVEVDEFNRRIKNDPRYLASVALGMGSAVVGVFTGSKLTVLGAVWSVLGDRLMSHVPVNKVILATSNFALKLSALRNPVERKAAFDKLVSVRLELEAQLSQCVTTCERAMEKAGIDTNTVTQTAVQVGQKAAKFAGGLLAAGRGLLGRGGSSQFRPGSSMGDGTVIDAEIIVRCERALTN